MHPPALHPVGPSTLVQPSRSPAASGSMVMKRARDAVSDDDGMRVLVDRLWPRGLTKDRLAVDLWLKEAAPSHALRRWYSHEPRRWETFQQKYRAELAQHDDLLSLLDDLRRRGRLTLVYDAADTSRNNAVVLLDVLSERCNAWARPNRS